METVVDLNLQTNFELITKISRQQRIQLLRWFARQNINFQNFVFEKQTNYYFKLKNEGIDKAILSLSSFILAIKELFDNEQVLKSKNKSQTLEKIRSLSKQEKIKFRKDKLQPKLQILLNLHSVVESLYFDGFSSRRIQNYILARHRKSVSHTLISQYIKDYILSSKESCK